MLCILGEPVLERACTHAAYPYAYENFEIEGRAIIIPIIRRACPETLRNMMVMRIALHLGRLRGNAISGRCDSDPCNARDDEECLLNMIREIVTLGRSVTWVVVDESTGLVETLEVEGKNMIWVSPVR